MQFPRTPASRFGLGAGLAGGALALVLVTGLGPAPALSSISSSQQQDDDSSSTSTSTTSTSTTVPTVATTPPSTETRVVDAAGAGTVTVSHDGAQLSIASAVPTTGWSVEIERSVGREVEVDFRLGAQRVQVDVELEDGVVRERVRLRDHDGGDDDHGTDD